MTKPARRPSSTTGRPLILRCSISRIAWAIVESGATVTNVVVMMSLAFIVVLLRNCATGHRADFYRIETDQYALENGGPRSAVSSNAF